MIVFPRILALMKEEVSSLFHPIPLFLVYEGAVSFHERVVWGDHRSIHHVLELTR